MQALYKLSYLKFKSKLRNVFSKPLSAILTVVAILFYGGTAVSMFFIPEGAADILFERTNLGVNMLILVLVGITAMMTFSMMLTRNKALFYREDAFYMFTSPFSFKQIMRYLLINNVLNALMLSAIIFYISIVLSMGLFSFGFLFLAFIYTTLIQVIILMLVDYFYLLELIHPKTKPVKWIFVGVIVLITVAVAGGSFIASDFNLQEGFASFVQSNQFNFVPLFGWMKFALLSIYEGNYVVALLIGLVFVAIIYGIYLFLINIKGDFFAEALEDAEKMSEILKASRKGKVVNKKEKVYEAKASFRPGEQAIFSKNVLLLKKGRDFLKKQDIFIILLYLVIAFFMTINESFGGYTMFSFMMVFWILSSVMQSSISDELKTYYIYLIPGNPYKKMFATVIPLLLKPVALICFAYILGGIVFMQNPLTILTSILQYTSIMFVMVAGNVLSTRIMKSQNNALVENLLRMLIMIITFIPVGVILLGLFFIVGLDTLTMIMPFVLAITNTLLAVGILFLCSPMLNGIEITISDEQ